MSQKINPVILTLIDDMLFERCVIIDKNFRLTQGQERISIITFKENPLVQSMFLDNKHYLMTIDWKLLQ